MSIDPVSLNCVSGAGSGSRAVLLLLTTFASFVAGAVHAEPDQAALEPSSAHEHNTVRSFERRVGRRRRMAAREAARASRYCTGRRHSPRPSRRRRLDRCGCLQTGTGRHGYILPFT